MTDSNIKLTEQEKVDDVLSRARGLVSKNQNNENNEISLQDNKNKQPQEVILNFNKDKVL